MNYFKLKFLLLFFALAVAIPPAWAGEESVTFSEQGYSNEEVITSYVGTNFSISFDKGTNKNAPKYFTSGTAIRIYGGNSMTVSSTKTITEIVITFGSSDGSNAITTDVGTYNNGTWTGSSNSVKFTIGGTSGNRRLAGVKVTYTEGGDTPPAEENIYQKVTNASQLVAGKTYIIVNESANVGMGAVDDNRYGTVVTELEFADGKVNIGGTEVMELTLGGKENAWTFMLPNSQYLAKGNNDNKFLLATTPSTSISKWAINLSDGCSIINNDDSYPDYRYIKYEKNRFDISSGSNIALYVKYEGGDEPQPADVTLSFPENSYTATLGETFNAPTLSVDPADAASEVTYSSSNTGVAMVDEETGAITLVAAGTTTITASINDSETYKNASASYILTVSPDLSNTAVLDFNEVNYWTPNLPTDNKLVDERSFTDGAGYTVKIAGSTGNGYYWTSHYLLLGKQGAYIQLPAFNRAVKSIVVEVPGTASTNVKQNIFVGETAVSTETTGNGNHTYNISSEYQRAGNIYTLKVTNGYNTQVKKIIIHFDENSSEVPLISVIPSSVTITDATGDDKTGAISATVDPAGTVTATATDGWSATSSSVTYEGKALHAEGTATFSSTGATDVEASLEYNYTGPLYILGTVNNGGWAPNNYVAMTRGADGLYTVRVTTNAGKEGLSWISFTKRVANDADDGAWNYIAPYRFVPYSKNGDAWWLTDGTVNQFNDLDFDPNHVDAQPVRMSPGTYDITINANDNTFKIEPYIVTVETPTFNPEAGSYKTFQSVTISCATEGATIHYTVDGSEPTESSPVYGDPISVKSKTTIKAIAMKSGMANSAIAEATYNLPQTVATMAEAMGVAANSYFLFTGDAVVTYAGQSNINSNYHYIFIRDKRAENGGGVIFYSTNNNVTVPSVQATNVLKRGWYAQLRPYNSWKEFQKAEFVEASGETAADDAAPFDRTGMELKYDDNVNEYVKIDNVTYNEGNITYAGQNREDVTYTYKVVNHFNVSLEDGKHYNIEGVVTRNNNTIEFYPTAATLAKQDLTLSFDPASVELYVGETFTAPALKGVPEGATIDVTYSSNNTDVATVTDNVVSLVKGATGTATITAAFAGNDEYNEASATYTIKVKAKEAAGLSYGEEPVTVAATYGDTEFTEPELTNAAGLAVTYSTSNDKVATVDEEGNVTIVGAGTATITATTEGDASHAGGSASYTINVAKAEAKVTFSEHEYTVYVNAKFTEPTLTTDPKGLEVTYSIKGNDSEIVLFDEEDGTVVIGEVPGTVTITATFAGNDNYKEASDSYTITVKAKEVATLSFDVEGITVYPNAEDFTQPKLTTTPENLTVTYTSTDDNIATVVNGVLMIGDKIGKATITATFAGNDEYAKAEASYTVTVEPRPIVVADEDVEFELYVGQTGTETFTVMAQNLKGDITLTLNDETGFYSIEPTTIDMDDAENATVTVTYAPTTEGFHEATVTLSTKDAEENVTVTLTGMAEVQPVVAMPTFSLVAGSYTGPQQVTIYCATEGATISYSTDGGSTWTVGNTVNVDKDMTIMAKAEMDGMTVSTTTSATYVIITEETPVTVNIETGYYQIKNLGNGLYANVAGRKTLNFADAENAKKMAGTVIYVDVENDGTVKSLRSQAADLQRYADRAMSYVPEVVKIVAQKLNADGSGEILGETGLNKILDKFNECFDHNLHVEQAGDGYRLYGKTPSMQPVVEFYRENKDKVEAKLPNLEAFINSALEKLKAKIGGSSVFTEFKLLDIWEKMGGTLTKPVDDASTMAFYREVLNNKNYVWDFAYQTAMIYVNNLMSHPRWPEVEAKLGEYAQYIDKIKQIRPEFKYYIVQKDGKPDFISEGNKDIIDNNPRTIWSLEKRTGFTVNFPEANKHNGEYVTTLYTDFAYTLPEGVTAYTVTEVSTQGVATLTALEGTIPAQTPVLLKSTAAGPQTVTLSTEAGTAPADNLLVGPDYLIKHYEFKTPQVVDIFNFIKDKLPGFYDEYVAQYEYLMLKTAGTVGNKYFWNVNSDLANLKDDCIVRSLAVDENGTLAFSDHWTTETNKAFLVDDANNPQDVIKLSLRGDINKDGVISIIDVTALIDILLDLPARTYLKPTDSYPKGLDYEAADVNEEKEGIEISDVTALIDILLNMPNQPAQGSGN